MSAVICKPVEVPFGIVNAGKPPKLKPTVYASDKYIAKGSCKLSPISGGLAGVTGDKIISTSLKSSVNLADIWFLKLCAFK